MIQVVQYGERSRPLSVSVQRCDFEDPSPFWWYFYIVVISQYHIIGMLLFKVLALLLDMLNDLFLRGLSMAFGKYYALHSRAWLEGSLLHLLFRPKIPRGLSYHSLYTGANNYAPPTRGRRYLICYCPRELEPQSYERSSGCVMMVMVVIATREGTWLALCFSAISNVKRYTEEGMWQGEL